MGFRIDGDRKDSLPEPFFQEQWPFFSVRWILDSPTQKAVEKTNKELDGIREVGDKTSAI